MAPVNGKKAPVPTPATGTTTPPKDLVLSPKETQDAAKETEVGKWLVANEADIFINEFYKQGYYKLDSVDDEAINSIVNPKDSGSANVKKPGLANTLKNSLAEQKKRKEEASKVTPAMVPPKLEASTVLDLSAPKLLSADGITFSVPKSLSVESTNAAIISPNNIKPEEWMVIARSANLLYAYDVDGDEPKWAKTPALDWKVPDRDDFARSEILHGKVTSVLTYTDETASYVASGFDAQTATLGFPFCAGSFERSHKYKTATNSESKTLIQVGLWKYPRVKIYLDKCTVTSERFITAVRNAVHENIKDKFGELNRVFKEYGHVIPSAVLLGGQLCYSESRVSNSSASENFAQEEIKGNVESKLSKVSASAGFGLGNASENKTGSENKEESTCFTNLGGDSLLCSNPPAWAPTVKDPKYWAVIEMEDMRPTIDLLDPGLKQKVLDVWNSSQAILLPKELEWQEGQGVLYPNSEKFKELLLKNGGFPAAIRYCGPGTRGWIQLISSNTRTDPKENDPGTAVGAAYAHLATLQDTWYECNSICMPVPQGGSFKTRFENTWPSTKPDARLIFIPSNLQFGQWQCLSDSIDKWVEQKPSSEDGFLFVTIQTVQNGDCGGVNGLLDEREVAGSYVHWFEDTDERINEQSFCIPVPAGSKFSIKFDPWSPTKAQPRVCVYWLPLVDENWKMQGRVQVTVNTQILAETDGILHGWIKQALNGDRGTLKIYTGSDAVNYPPQGLPCSATSMHYYEQNNRWVKYSSVMLPVAKGTPYKAVFTPTNGSPQSQVWWTAIVPR